MTTGRPPLREILAGDDWMKVAADRGRSVAEIAKVIAPLTGLPASVMQATLDVADTLGKRLGLKCVRRVERTAAAPYATVARALVLSVVSHRHPITALFDTPRGAFVEAQLPGDMLSLGGSLKFDIVEAAPGQIHLWGVSEIKGQLFDWGKGKKALNEVMGQAEAFAARMHA